ncbi:MAG: LytTR family transcriptional regulator, partial [Lacticaseibacillus paracasei]
MRKETEPMKVSFDQDPDLNPDDIEVLIKA